MTVLLYLPLTINSRGHCNSSSRPPPPHTHTHTHTHTSRIRTTLLRGCSCRRKTKNKYTVMILCTLNDYCGIFCLFKKIYITLICKHRRRHSLFFSFLFSRRHLLFTTMAWSAPRVAQTGRRSGRARSHPGVVPVMGGG